MAKLSSRVQLKGRLTFKKEYSKKGIYVAFHTDGEWYLYSHDELLEKVLAATTIGNTESWKTGGGYSFRVLSRQLQELLAEYKIIGTTQPIPDDNA
jgi:hypothetical protein